MWLPWRQINRQIPKPTAKPIYGVNIGGWLLLEKWMTPSLFAGTDAVDEYTLYQNASPELQQKLQHHRDTFITLQDFVWLQLHGIEAVRLPVGYWVFDGDDPYQPCIEYVDKAFAWAEETGLKILLDLHGAPGSQNGKQESGRIGAIGWHKNRKNIIRSLEVIKRLAERYKDSTALLGIELLNEPSAKIPRRVLKEYYQAGYKIIRQICGSRAWVVFSDNFKPRRWKRHLRGSEYELLYMDTHHYQLYTKRDKKRSIAEHLEHAVSMLPAQLADMLDRHQVIVGEWSIGLPQRALQFLDSEQSAAAYRAYANAQLIAFGMTRGWFYWSYKTEDKGPWSFRDCVENNRLPELKDI